MTDLLVDNGDAEPVAPPKKRSLFSKAARENISETDEAVDFFSRAKEIYPQRLAEEERRRQKKRVKLERKRSSTSADHKESTPPGGKKRRLSSQADERDGHSSDSARELDQDEELSWTPKASTHSTPSSQHRKSHSSPSHRKSHTSPQSLSARYNKDLQADKRQPANKDYAPKGYISVSDSDSEGEKTAMPIRKPPNQLITLDDDDDWSAPAPRQAPRQVVEDDLQFSDEEFPELIQQAKERERQKMLQKQNSAKSFGEQNHGANDILDDIFDSGSTATFDSDPTIEILITSKIEGTMPLKVRRKLSQRLKEVRLSWCDKQFVNGQPFDQNTKDAIYLTWKKIKLFDVTTCRSLGLKIDGRGNPSDNGEGIDPEGRIHMEAWTEETYKIYEKRKAAKQKRERGESDGEAAGEQEKENAVRKTKLIMKARNLDDYKITVKATTTIERMIGAFRQGRGVPDEKQIAIHLEGDELNPATTIGDLDLEDMDIVEVHIR